MNKPIILCCILILAILTGCEDIETWKQRVEQAEKANQVLRKTKAELEDKLKLAENTIKEKEEEIKRLQEIVDKYRNNKNFQEENEGYLKEMFGTKR